jgi:hypothetical protein
MKRFHIPYNCVFEADDGYWMKHADHEAALAEAVAKAWEEAEKVAGDCPCHWDGEQIAKAIRRARGAAHD